MKMENIEVFANQGNTVTLLQQGLFGDDMVIVIAPEQIPILIEWLNAAQTEAQEVALNGASS